MLFWSAAEVVLLECKRLGTPEIARDFVSGSVRLHFVMRCVT
jgi:hypothetical protein